MVAVLDASVAASWVFPDEHDQRADRALQLLVQEGVIVPIQWWFEIRNVLILGERRSRITSAQSAEFLESLQSLSIELDDLPPSPLVLGFARKHRLSFYDAAYLELAKRRNIPLATLDNALSEAARAEGIALI
jgi:predicted nucleic acid-binding protein